MNKATMNLNINKYRNALQNIIDYGGGINETTIRRCFIDMVNDFVEDKNLKLIEELEYRTPQGTTVYPDGTLKDRFRLSCGYYEAKDPKDDLDKEIEDKTRKYYPLLNTIFENSRFAVLYQNNLEYMRIDMSDDGQLEKLLNAFIDFERREINPDFSFEDIREILIQHMLTNKLFIAVFNEAEFHKANNIALSIDAIVDTFFTREKKKEFEDKNKHFYHTISITASQIMDHHEKQDFLKTLYEEFYKTYNPKEADRLGVVYTPSQIVDFMIRTTDDLLAKHFNTGLVENNVKIIDPATGTGTFITALIDRIPPAKLKHKYLNELFANEVGILPYYVSNLNIEYTYWQKMDAYLEFPNICYTDTLDNSYYIVDIHGQPELINLLTEENAKRLQNQNESKISVVIGNPSYNANQKNYNNKDELHREHPAIPFYKNFKKWATWGKSLMDIHVNYETAEEYPVNISVSKNENIKNESKFDKKSNRIIIDDTAITGIPPEALHYKLCIRSALEWIIDQYKIRLINDKTILEYFNDYHYSAYKNEIITLVKKIITVSLKTLEIIQQMEAQTV
ncbi:MAG: N-6 DNA methylase [Treponema sp.]|nr:N-6 DNA methylase [Treponema sp.]